MTKKLACAVIPAYNEEKTIGRIVEQTLNYIDTCFVVNDGSTDRTAFLAEKAGARVINKRLNSGSGRAIQTGLKTALKNNFSYFILLDADGQHNPKYIKKLLAAIERFKADLVIASRYLKKTEHCTSFFRRLGTRLISFLFFWKFRLPITDPTSGFRCFNRQTAVLAVKNYGIIFPEPEVLIALIGEEKKIMEISVPMEKRKYGRTSISPLRAFYLMFYILSRIIPARDYP